MVLFWEMIPCRYLEQTSLAARDAEGAAYTAVKFRGSAHVAHLRTEANILLKSGSVHLYRRIFSWKSGSIIAMLDPCYFLKILNPSFWLQIINLCWRKHKAEYRRQVRQFLDTANTETREEKKKTFLQPEPFTTSFTAPWAMNIWYSLFIYSCYLNTNNNF